MPPQGIFNVSGFLRIVEIKDIDFIQYLFPINDSVKGIREISRNQGKIIYLKTLINILKFEIQQCSTNKNVLCTGFCVGYSGLCLG